MDTNSVLAIIGPLSPSLAAYHHKDTAPDRCQRCGHLLIPGSSSIRIARSSTTRKRKRKYKDLCMRQTCATCEYVNNTVLHPATHHSAFHTTPPLPKTVLTPHTHCTDQSPLPDPHSVPTSHLHSPHPLPSSSPLTNPQPQLQTKSKRSRPKHKAGLQEMLARNKDRQRDAANSRDSSGLATFLHGL